MSTPDHLEPIEKLTFLEHMQSHRYGKLFLPILSIFGLSDLPSAVYRGQPPYLLIASLTACVVFFLFSYHSIRPQRLRTKEEAREFYPFASSLSADQRDKFMVPRSAETERLASLLQKNETIHTVVAGNSGVGKTSLIGLYLRSLPKNVRVVHIDEFLNSSYDLLNRVFALSDPDRGVEIERKVSKLIQSTAMENGTTSISEIVDDLLSLIKKKFVEDSLVIVIFDQSERFSANINEMPEREQFLVRIILNRLKLNPWTRTLFAIRSDKISSLLKQLDPMSFEIMFLDGITSHQNDTGYQDVRGKFGRLGCSASQFQDIMFLLEDRSAANTLGVSIAGYIVENMSVSFLLDCKKYNSSNGLDRILSIYVDLLFREYQFLQKDTASPTELEASLFAFALYNSRTGLPCTIKEVSSISHLPIVRVRRAIAYLRSRNVVKEEENHPDRLRLAHDLIADHVLRRDRSWLRLDHAVAMEQIVDRGISERNLFTVKEEKDPFISTVLNGMVPSPAAFLLWVAAVAYGMRIAFPEIVWKWLQPLNSAVEKLLPGTLSHDPATWWFFIPVALTQYIWVLFMYGLDRGFFSYITRFENRPVMGFLIHIAGPLGATLGFLLSFFPSLFIIPIAIPGIILATSYAILSAGQVEEKLVRRYFVELSLGTAVNMVGIFVMCIGLTELYILRQGETKDFRDAVSILLVCLLLCYFAFQMRGRQGSQFGRAAMLTVYDAGRQR